MSATETEEVGTLKIKKPRKVKQVEEVVETEVIKTSADSDGIQIPTPKVISKLSTFRKEDVDTIEACISLSRPVLLVGQTGLGKTTLIKELANKHNKTLTRLSVHSGVSGDEILGKWLAKNGSTVWQSGLLVQAMEKGEWIVFDEINACSADVLFALHSLLDDDRKITLIEKDGEVIRPHADFRFFATMNPVEDYAGTKEMNMAFASRFGATIEIKAYSMDQEMRILENNGCPNKAVNGRLVKIANSLRDLKAQEKITFYCGTRDLINVAMLEPKIGIDLALSVGLINKISPDDKEECIKIIGNLNLPLTAEQQLVKDQQTEIKRLQEVVQQNQARNNTLSQELNKSQTARAMAENSAKAMSEVVKKLEKDIANGAGQSSAVNTNNVHLDPKATEALRILGIIK